MTKSKHGTAAKIRGKRRRSAHSASAAKPQAELLPAEDSYERALAAVKTERSRAFVQELVRTWPQLDGKAAALAAGCSPGIAKKTATPEQQAEEVLRTAWLMARANVLWFTRISSDRKLLIPDFSHATDEMLACIEAFDISERGIKLRLKDSSKALALLARATGVDRPEVKVTGNVEFRVVYEQTPERLSRELGELGTGKTTQPDEALDDPIELLPVKKFPIN
jgi:hypothetical protein